MGDWQKRQGVVDAGDVFIVPKEYLEFRDASIASFGTGYWKMDCHQDLREAMSAEWVVE
jgi:hypothetical protein